MSAKARRKASNQPLVDLLIDWQLRGDQATAANIVRILFKKRETLQAFRWMQRLDDLSGFDPVWLLKMRGLLPRSFLCIGGGPDYVYPSWDNLDAYPGPLNPKPFDFGQHSKFPFKARSFQIVYAPMILPEMAEGQFANVVSEIARVITPGGALIAAAPEAHCRLFSTMLARAGFDTLSVDTARIKARFDYIPRIGRTPEGNALIFATRQL